MTTHPTSKEEAKSLVKQAVAFLRSEGGEAGLAEFVNPSGEDGRSASDREYPVDYFELLNYLGA